MVFFKSYSTLPQSQIQCQTEQDNGARAFIYVFPRLNFYTIQLLLTLPCSPDRRFSGKPRLQSSVLLAKHRGRSKARQPLSLALKAVPYHPSKQNLYLRHGEWPYCRNSWNRLHDNRRWWLKSWRYQKRCQYCTQCYFRWQCQSWGVRKCPILSSRISLSQFGRKWADTGPAKLRPAGFDRWATIISVWIGQGGARWFGSRKILFEPGVRGLRYPEKRSPFCNGQITLRVRKGCALKGLEVRHFFYDIGASIIIRPIKSIMLKAEEVES